MEQAFHKKKALVVVTSVNMLRSSSSSEKRPTGVNLKELAYLYEHLFKQHPQINWTIASPAGSEIPLDPASARERERDNILEEFMKDKKIQEMLRHAPALSSINPEEYSAVFFIGGPGSMLDLPEEEQSICKIVKAVYQKNEGIVASIGYGLAAIVGLRHNEEGEGDSDDDIDESEERERERERRRNPESIQMSQSQGCAASQQQRCYGATSAAESQPQAPQHHKKSFIQNREITGMTKEEDEELGLKEFLPFALEDRASENSAQFIKKPKFTANVVVSERLITAQNEQSASLWVQKIIEVCRSEQSKKPNK